MIQALSLLVKLMKNLDFAAQLSMDTNLTSGNYIPYDRLSQPNYLITAGILISLVFGYAYAKNLQDRFSKLKEQNTSSDIKISLFEKTSWIAIFFGLTILFTGVLLFLGFVFSKSLLISLILTMPVCIWMWNLIKELMLQVKSGTIKEIDDYF